MGNRRENHQPQNDSPASINRKKTNPLSSNTHVFEMPADTRGDSARKGCVGLIQSKRKAVANVSGGASKQAHCSPLWLAFQPLVLQLPFCTTGSSPPVRSEPVPQVCVPSFPHVQEGVQYHDHSGQLCWICSFSEKEKKSR